MLTIDVPVDVFVKKLSTGFQTFILSGTLQGGGQGTKDQGK